MQNVEDMGYVALPSGTRFLSENQLGPILKSLATLHASSIAYEKQEGKSIGVEFREVLYEVSVHPDVDWYTTGLRVSKSFLENNLSYLMLCIYSGCPGSGCHPSGCLK